MKIIFEINHPKHYYQFKYLAKFFEVKHDVFFVARNKEIVFKILENEKVKYKKFGTHYKSLMGKLVGAVEIFITYNKIIKEIKPDLIISKASPYSTLLCYSTKIKTIIFPDSEIVELTNKLVSKLADYVITPKFFLKDYGKKHYKVNGFFEECYLCPEVFTPDPKIKKQLSPDGRAYAILRFVSWNANHDVGKSAVSSQLIEKIIRTINQYLNVYITCEAVLPEKLVKYELPIPKNQIHSALFYADLYVGDSQSMATESALLGTPAIRCNKFVGEHDMNIFKVLENKYNLLLNFSDWDSALTKAEEICKNPELKKEWHNNTEKYYNDKEDLNKQIISIIEEII